MKKKIFIALDGLDASGKHTQSELLCDSFNKNGIKYRCVSFPTYDEKYSAMIKLYLSGAFGDDPKAVNAYAASSFFAVDRYASYMLDWKKDHDEGTVILADRYTTANAVHQLSKLPKEEWDKFLGWLMHYEFDLLGLPSPDLVIYLSVSPELSAKTAAKRANETGVSRDIHEKSKDHLIKSYEAAQYACDKLGWKRINCEKDGTMRNKEEIHKEILSYVAETLKQEDETLK